MAQTQSPDTGALGLHVGAMLQTHPQSSQLDRGLLQSCIEACFDCAQTCTSCADACLGEKDVTQLVNCIRRNLDCANVCETTGKVLTRQTAFDPQLARTLLQSCLLACRACAEECERHAARMKHCQVCAEACRRCEQACDRLLAVAKA